MTDNTVTLRLDEREARALWHATCTAVELMEAVEAEPGNAIPPHAPLYGQRGRLIAVAQRLDHEINQASFNPLGGAARGAGRCVCAAGPGTNPACQVHP